MMKRDGSLRFCYGWLGFTAFVCVAISMLMIIGLLGWGLWHNSTVSSKCLDDAFAVVRAYELEPGIDLTDDEQYERWRECYTGDTWDWAK